MRRNSFNRKLRRALAASLGAFAFASSAYVAEAAEANRKKLIKEIVGFFADLNVDKQLLKASRVLPAGQPQKLPNTIEEAKALLEQIPPVMINGKQITLDSNNAHWMGQSLKTEIKVNGENINWKVVLREVVYDAGGISHHVGFVILPTHQQMDVDIQKQPRKVNQANAEERMLRFAHAKWVKINEEILKKEREDFLREMINLRGGLDEKPKNKLDIQNDVDRYEKIQKWRDKWDADKPNREKRKREKENAIEAKLAAEKERNQNNDNYSSYFSSAGSTNYNNPISSFNPAVGLASFAATIPAMTSMGSATVSTITTPVNQVTAGPNVVSPNGVTTPVGPLAQGNMTTGQTQLSTNGSVQTMHQTGNMSNQANADGKTTHLLNHNEDGTLVPTR